MRNSSVDSMEDNDGGGGGGGKKSKKAAEDADLLTESGEASGFNKTTRFEPTWPEADPEFYDLDDLKTNFFGDDVHAMFHAMRAEITQRHTSSSGSSGGVFNLLCWIFSEFSLFPFILLFYFKFFALYVLWNCFVWLFYFLLRFFFFFCYTFYCRWWGWHDFVSQVEEDGSFQRAHDGSRPCRFHDERGVPPRPATGE